MVDEFFFITGNTAEAKTGTLPKAPMVIVEVRDLQGPRATVTALRASPFRLKMRCLAFLIELSEEVHSKFKLLTSILFARSEDPLETYLTTNARGHKNQNAHLSMIF